MTHETNPCVAELAAAAEGAREEVELLLEPLIPLPGTLSIRKGSAVLLATEDTRAVAGGILPAGQAVMIGNPEQLPGSFTLFAQSNQLLPSVNLTSRLFASAALWLAPLGVQHVQAVDALTGMIRLERVYQGPTLRDLRVHLLPARGTLVRHGMQLPTTLCATGGQTLLTAAADLSELLAAGDVLMLDNVEYRLQSVAGTQLELEQPYVGASAPHVVPVVVRNHAGLFVLQLDAPVPMPTSHDVQWYRSPLVGTATVRTNTSTARMSTDVRAHGVTVGSSLWLRAQQHTVEAFEPDAPLSSRCRVQSRSLFVMCPERALPVGRGDVVRIGGAMQLYAVNQPAKSVVLSPLLASVTTGSSNVTLTGATAAQLAELMVTGTYIRLHPEAPAVQVLQVGAAWVELFVPYADPSLVQQPVELQYFVSQSESVPDVVAEAQGGSAVVTVHPAVPVFVEVGDVVRIVPPAGDPGSLAYEFSVMARTATTLTLNRPFADVEDLEEAESTLYVVLHRMALATPYEGPSATDVLLAWAPNTIHFWPPYAGPSTPALPVFMVADLHGAVTVQVGNETLSSSVADLSADLTAFLLQSARPAVVTRRFWRGGFKWRLRFENPGMQPATELCRNAKCAGLASSHLAISTLVRHGRHAFPRDAGGWVSLPVSGTTCGALAGRTTATVRDGVAVFNGLGLQGHQGSYFIRFVVHRQHSPSVLHQPVTATALFVDSPTFLLHDAVPRALRLRAQPVSVVDGVQAFTAPEVELVVDAQSGAVAEVDGVEVEVALAVNQGRSGTGAMSASLSRPVPATLTLRPGADTAVASRDVTPWVAPGTPMLVHGYILRARPLDAQFQPEVQRIIVRGRNVTEGQLEVRAGGVGVMVNLGDDDRAISNTLENLPMFQYIALEAVAVHIASDRSEMRITLTFPREAGDLAPLQVGNLTGLALSDSNAASDVSSDAANSATVETVSDGNFGVIPTAMYAINIVACCSSGVEAMGTFRLEVDVGGLVETTAVLTSSSPGRAAEVSACDSPALQTALQQLQAVHEVQVDPAQLQNEIGGKQLRVTTWLVTFVQPRGSISGFRARHVSMCARQRLGVLVTATTGSNTLQASGDIESALMNAPGPRLLAVGDTVREWATVAGSVITLAAPFMGGDTTEQLSICDSMGDVRLDVVTVRNGSFHVPLAFPHAGAPIHAGHVFVPEGRALARTVRGVARFEDLRIFAGASGWPVFTLEFAARGLAVESSPVVVVRSQPVSLEVAQEPPALTAARSEFSLTIRLQLTADAREVVHVRHFPLSDTDSAASVLAGPSVVKSAAGVAQFSGLSISRPGLYRLRAALGTGEMLRYTLLCQAPLYELTDAFFVLRVTVPGEEHLTIPIPALATLQQLRVALERLPQTSHVEVSAATAERRVCAAAAEPLVLAFRTLLGTSSADAIVPSMALASENSALPPGVTVMLGRQFVDSSVVTVQAVSSAGAADRLEFVSLPAMLRAPLLSPGTAVTLAYVNRVGQVVAPSQSVALRLSVFQPAISEALCFSLAVAGTRLLRTGSDPRGHVQAGEQLRVGGALYSVVDVQEQHVEVDRTAASNPSAMSGVVLRDPARHLLQEELRGDVDASNWRAVFTDIAPSKVLHSLHFQALEEEEAQVQGSLFNVVRGRRLVTFPNAPEDLLLCTRIRFASDDTHYLLAAFRPDDLALVLDRPYEGATRLVAAFWYPELDAVQTLSTSTTGVLPIQGSYALELHHWGTSQRTADIAHNATAEDVRTALLALPNVRDVYVVRTNNPAKESTKLNEYQYVIGFPAAGRVEALVAVNDRLTAPDGTVRIEVVQEEAGLPSTRSSTFAVGNGLPAGISLAQQPASAVAGARFVQPAVLEVVDADGQQLSGVSVNVTASLALSQREQHLLCAAQGGAFMLRFGELPVATPAIPWDVRLAPASSDTPGASLQEALLNVWVRVNGSVIAMQGSVVALTSGDLRSAVFPGDDVRLGPDCDVGGVVFRVGHTSVLGSTSLKLPQPLPSQLAAQTLSVCVRLARRVEVVPAHPASQQACTPAGTRTRIRMQQLAGIMHGKLPRLWVSNSTLSGTAASLVRLECTATGGALRWSYRGVTSERVLASATAAELLHVLRRLPTLAYDAALLHANEGGAPICKAGGATTWLQLQDARGRHSAAPLDELTVLTGMLTGGSASVALSGHAHVEATPRDAVLTPVSAQVDGSGSQAAMAALRIDRPGSGYHLRFVQATTPAALVYSMRCTASGGTLALRFGSAHTVHVAASASPNDLAAALGQLPYVGSVSVVPHPPDAAICSSSGIAQMSIHVHQLFQGSSAEDVIATHVDLPMLSASDEGLRGCHSGLLAEHAAVVSGSAVVGASVAGHLVPYDLVWVEDREYLVLEVAQHTVTLQRPVDAAVNATTLIKKQLTDPSVVVVAMFVDAEPLDVRPSVVGERLADARVEVGVDGVARLRSRSSGEPLDVHALDMMRVNSTQTQVLQGGTWVADVAAEPSWTDWQGTVRVQQPASLLLGLQFHALPCVLEGPMQMRPDANVPTLARLMDSATESAVLGDVVWMDVGQRFSARSDVSVSARLADNVHRFLDAVGEAWSVMLDQKGGDQLLLAHALVPPGPEPVPGFVMAVEAGVVFPRQPVVHVVNPRSLPLGDGMMQATLVHDNVLELRCNASGGSFMLVDSAGSSALLHANRTEAAVWESLGVWMDGLTGVNLLFADTVCTEDGEGSLLLRFREEGPAAAGIRVVPVDLRGGHAWRVVPADSADGRSLVPLQAGTAVFYDLSVSVATWGYRLQFSTAANGVQGPMRLLSPAFRVRESAPVRLSFIVEQVQPVSADQARLTATVAAFDGAHNRVRNASGLAVFTATDVMSSAPSVYLASMPVQHGLARLDTTVALSPGEYVVQATATLESGVQLHAQSTAFVAVGAPAAVVVESAPGSRLLNGVFVVMPGSDVLLPQLQADYRTEAALVLEELQPGSSVLTRNVSDAWSGGLLAMLHPFEPMSAERALFAEPLPYFMLRHELPPAANASLLPNVSMPLNDTPWPNGTEDVDGWQNHTLTNDSDGQPAHNASLPQNGSDQEWALNDSEWDNEVVFPVDEGSGQRANETQNLTVTTSPHNWTARPNDSVSNASSPGNWSGSGPNETAETGPSPPSVNTTAGEVGANATVPTAAEHRSIVQLQKMVGSMELLPAPFRARLVDQRGSTVANDSATPVTLVMRQDLACQSTTLRGTNEWQTITCASERAAFALEWPLEAPVLVLWWYGERELRDALRGWRTVRVVELHMPNGGRLCMPGAATTYIRFAPVQQSWLPSTAFPLLRSSTGRTWLLHCNVSSQYHRFAISIDGRMSGSMGPASTPEALQRALEAHPAVGLVAVWSNQATLCSDQEDSGGVIIALLSGRGVHMGEPTVQLVSHQASKATSVDLLRIAPDWVSTSGSSAMPAIAGVVHIEKVLLDTACENVRLEVLGPGSEPGSGELLPAIRVVPSNPTWLQVVTQPSGAQAGLPLLQQPVVALVDEGGNVVTAPPVMVMASLHGCVLSNASVELQGTVAVPSVRGIADFAGAGLLVTHASPSCVLSFGTSPALPGGRAVRPLWRCAAMLTPSLCSCLCHRPHG